MLQIKNSSTDPYYNLALEEYLLKQKKIDDNLFMLWQNEPVIVIGKNQNAYEELDLDYTKEQKIKVVRRMSGGGAVYHDLGNLNFTVIKRDGELQKNDFSFFALPVIQCLSYYGIDADFNGRNDILIEGKKFSGNAQYFSGNKVLHHGTLLFSSDLSVLSKALRVKRSKMESKGIKSVESRVVNIRDYIGEDVTLEKFSHTLAAFLSGGSGNKSQVYSLTSEEQREVETLKEKKYGTWKWNFGQSPEMDCKKEKRFPAGEIAADIRVEEGTIKRIRITGDFFEVSSVRQLEDHLAGQRYERAELEWFLKDEPVSGYILSLENKEFLDLLFT